MDNLFGVVHRPMFDTSIFSVNQPLHVIDYKKGLEYPGIVTRCDPMFIELLCYDVENLQGKYMQVSVDDFVGELYEFKALTSVDLEKLNEKEDTSGELKSSDTPRDIEEDLAKNSNSDFIENSNIGGIEIVSSESFIDSEVCDECKEEGK